MTVTDGPMNPARVAMIQMQAKEWLTRELMDEEAMTTHPEAIIDPAHRYAAAAEAARDKAVAEGKSDDEVAAIVVAVMAGQDVETTPPKE